MKRRVISRTRGGLLALAILSALIAGNSALAASASGPITSVEFSPDGSFLAIGSHHSLVVRPASGAADELTIACGLERISGISFDRQGRWLAVAGGKPGVEGALVLIDWRTRRVAGRFTNQTDLVTSVDFNSDGSALAVSSADHSARVFRVGKDGEQLIEMFSLVGHAGPVLTTRFSPSGKTILTGSADRSLKVWSADDGRLIRSFGHHTDAVHALAFRPGTPVGAPVQCASASSDGTVRVWQPEIGRMVRIIRKHKGSVLALAYAPDGGALFSAGEEGTVRRLDPDSDQVVEEWKAHDDWIYSLAVSPDGTRLVTGDWSGFAKCWDLSVIGKERRRD